jgi:hypothetical protein
LAFGAAVAGFEEAGGAAGVDGGALEVAAATVSPVALPAAPAGVAGFLTARFDPCGRSAFCAC